MNKLLSLVSGALFIAGSAGASAASIDQLLSRIELHEQKSSTVRFHYQQETRFENGGPSSKAQGSILMGKPDKVRLHQAKPEERLTISDGSQTWIYAPAFKQVWFSKKPVLSNLFSADVLPLENVAETLRKGYDLTILSESTGTNKVVRLAAVAKDKSQDVRLEISFNEEDWLPLETVYQTSTARITTQVSDTEVNPVVKETDFKFSPPRGAEVIPF